MMNTSASTVDHWFRLLLVHHRSTPKHITIQLMNHHVILTDEEQNMIINALAFFDQLYSTNRIVDVDEVVKEWQDVADDTDLTLVDKLATKIATSN